MSDYNVSRLVRGLYQILSHSSTNFNHDCLSDGQIESKLWLVNTVNELDLSLGKVFLCAGWYGTLATLLFESEAKCESIHSFDIDPTCAWYAETFNRPWVTKGWKFKASTVDIHEMKYPFTWCTQRSNGTDCPLTVMPDTIINTSCEHIDHFNEWLDRVPAGTTMILQSNNLDIPEHVNKVNSIDEFLKMCKFSSVLFSGTKTMEKMNYDRYMIIGVK